MRMECVLTFLYPGFCFLPFSIPTRPGGGDTHEKPKKRSGIGDMNEIERSLVEVMIKKRRKRTVRRRRGC